MATELVTATVAEIPPCDFCGDDAAYDGKTVQGPWAFMCRTDFQLYGVGLGMGRGQRLLLSTDKDQ